jgi:hypothetical protein
MVATAEGTYVKKAGDTTTGPFNMSAPNNKPINLYGTNGVEAIDFHADIDSTDDFKNRLWQNNGLLRVRAYLSQIGDTTLAPITNVTQLHLNNNTITTTDSDDTINGFQVNYTAYISGTATINWSPVSNSDTDTVAHYGFVSYTGNAANGIQTIESTRYGTVLRRVRSGSTWGPWFVESGSVSMDKAGAWSDTTITNYNKYDLNSYVRTGTFIAGTNLYVNGITWYNTPVTTSNMRAFMLTVEGGQSGVNDSDSGNLTRQTLQFYNSQAKYVRFGNGNAMSAGSMSWSTWNVIWPTAITATNDYEFEQASTLEANVSETPDGEVSTQDITE